MKKNYLKFVDFWDGFDTISNFIVDALSIQYEVVLSNEPDYLFYSCFGTSHLEYDCIKIMFIGENIVPDFNVCDYAIGFNYIDFGDRYLRLPLYAIYDGFSNLQNKKIDVNKALDRKFCSIVVSNNKWADPIRETFFKLLSSYKKVDSGGRAWNNIGGPVDNKLDFISQYKFNIAFENSRVLGYTTEKIMEPMQVNSIPVYWGNPLVGKDFNVDSFVNAHDFDSLERLVEYIIELDSSKDKYLEMLEKPWLLDKTYLDWKQLLLNFINNIMMKSYKDAKYLVNYGHAGKYRNEQRFWGRCERKFKLQRIIEYYSQLFDRK
ncbi:glycosyltransferase family 10 domain-containing protein [Bacteroides fragilis]|uniref:glycosyltransferase family 10 domain-containing protein n=1 Tax=Bacteroides fragilis TaxID=817 RepID=UPI00216B30E9|nr:glycosyltransferase family 10 [Bacteroides fragilis]